MVKKVRLAFSRGFFGLTGVKVTLVFAKKVAFDESNHDGWNGEDLNEDARPRGHEISSRPKKQAVAFALTRVNYPSG